jgi:hypothetical protein
VIHFHIQKQARTKDGKRVIVRHTHRVSRDKPEHEHDGLRGFARTMPEAERLAEKYDEQMRAYFAKRAVKK